MNVSRYLLKQVVLSRTSAKLFWQIYSDPKKVSKLFELVITQPNRYNITTARKQMQDVKRKFIGKFT
jgi:hypothetical protein